MLFRSGESLEGSGIEDLVEEKLADFAKELIDCTIVPEYGVLDLNYIDSAEDLIERVSRMLDDLNVKYIIDVTGFNIKYELPIKL